MGAHEGRSIRWVMGGPHGRADATANILRTGDRSGPAAAAAPCSGLASRRTTEGPPLPEQVRALRVERGDYAESTNWISSVTVTSLPSVKPPASSAAFQLTPNSVRSIFVVAEKPSFVWP